MRNFQLKRLAFAISVMVLASSAHASECVILLHGLLRNSGSMEALEKPLREAGFHVVNEGYPSTTNDIVTLANVAIPDAISKCQKDAAINFVTHSMGGILVRAYYRNREHKPPKRVVMLAPPNQGSEIIDTEAFEWFGSVSGEAGAQLGTEAHSIPNTLGAVNFELGVIAGDYSINPIFSAMIPGDDDGAVAVDRTHVAGEKDWILITASHSLMMYNREAQRQAVHFLVNGAFDR